MLRLIAALLLAVGLVVSGWFIGNGFEHSRNERYVSVKGLAERNVKADIALWRIRFVETGNQLADAQARVQHDEEVVTAFLAKHKLGNGAIAFRNIQVTDRAAQMYGNAEYKTRFIVTGTLMVRTKDVDAVAAAAQDTGALIGQGGNLVYNASVGYAFNDTIELSLSLTNIFDRSYSQNAYAITQPWSRTLAMPRTFFVSATVKY
jgi:hypothetical protein